ncbi:MAG: MDR/zinc-dependent alcohol dehydrogenase-like family protein [Candidatus Binataceae bacterium]
MRALVLNQRLSFQSDYRQPQSYPGESTVRVHLAGICGTDLELARGYMAYVGVPGHEFVGHVVESGQPRLLGVRVTGEINAACYACECCFAGLGRHCPNRTVLGILGRDGAFADYLRLPDKNLVPIPDSMPDELAVFIEPVAAAYEIFDQVRIGRDQKIAILGDGRLGATVAMVLNAEGYEPIVGGHHEAKLQHLAALGLKVELEARLEAGFDVVADCTGTSAGFNRAAALVKPRGRLILKSTAAANAPMNLGLIVVNEITVVGSRCGRFAPALAAIKEGRVDPRPLISATYPLERGLAAFQAAATSTNFKVLLKIS